jgi:hypothetical protein
MLFLLFFLFYSYSYLIEDTFAQIELRDLLFLGSFLDASTVGRRIIYKSWSPHEISWYH